MSSSVSPWNAPRARGPINWVQQVPGSKSITNRAFILAAIADSPSTIEGALRSRDTDLMAEAIRALGVGISGGDTLRITPGEFHGAQVDCGLAGTIMRFLPPIATLARGTVLFDGDPQARVRPMSTILDALRTLGASVDGERLPFTVYGQGAPEGGTVEIDASGSSQFVSGLLLAGARFRRGLTVRHTGATLPSLPHIEMTVDMLRQARVRVEVSQNEWTVYPGTVDGKRWVIEPDLSNATPFLAAAAVTGGTVRIPHWPIETTQPGDVIRTILEKMGCTVELIAEGDHHDLEVTGPVAPLRGISLEMSDIGELTPTVAALAALAGSESHLSGIAHLRGHETDRLAALTTEINRLGGDCEELSDGLLIRPAQLHGGVWHSYADHRMATAGAIIGLAVDGVQVEDVQTTAKTLPGFEHMWEAMVSANG